MYGNMVLFLKKMSNLMQIGQMGVRRHISPSSVIMYVLVVEVQVYVRREQFDAREQEYYDCLQSETSTVFNT